MKGKGVKDVQGLQQGDQHVRVIVETPTHLTAKQKELLKEFAELVAKKSIRSRKASSIR